ncbi:MAG: hypothetical protein NZM42_12625 [Gemmatales bacterium]|nr:hypothetical protein [Gemmatales bacterium]MDW8222855.1 hypothetical protein [Gemmatales bacterium]
MPPDVMGALPDGKLPCAPPGGVTPNSLFGTSAEGFAEPLPETPLGDTEPNAPPMSPPNPADNVITFPQPGHLAACIIGTPPLGTENCLPQLGQLKLTDIVTPSSAYWDAHPAGCRWPHSITAR